MAIIVNKNASTTPRNYAVSTVRGLEQALQNLQRMVAIGGGMSAGEVEAAFDLAAGQGAAFITLVGALNTALTTGATATAVNNYINQFIP